MTVTISFRPDTEAKLREQAVATGKDVPTLVVEAVEEKFAGGNGIKPPAEVPYEQWVVEFDAWVASHKPVGHFVDDSRESIYAGRGE
jgi:hypothetical protein